MTASPFLDAALSYAARGWAVFPLRPHSKAPATEHGFKQATTDEAQIRAWWGARPDCNVGIRTGATSRLWVFDVDPRHNGTASLFTLQQRIGKWETVEVVTGWGGTHFYFAWDDARPVGCQSGGKRALPEGLDVKGDGGYVVAPPSIHPDTGRTYEWELSAHPDDTPVASAPLALLELVYESTRRDGEHRKAAFEAPGAETVYADGHRDEALTSLAGRLRNQGFGLSDMLTAMHAYNEAHCVPPMPRAQVEKIVRSSMKWEQGSPLKKKAEPVALKADDLDGEETDEADTRRLVARDGHRLRYCSELKRWYVWDGVIWRPDRTLAVEAIAREAARAHTVEVAASGADVKRINRALAMEGRGHVIASLNGAASDHTIAALPEELDTDPDILATTNGWIDLRTGARLEPTPEKFITQIAPTGYDPAATCPRWERFIAEIACDRYDIVEFLRVWVGYCLTGHTKEQCMVVAYGRGANGKGTMWDTLRRHVFGLSYSCEAPPKFLLSRDGDSHPTELMDLFRRRLVTASEVPDEARWDEAKVKRLSGEDAIKGRKMYQDFGNEFQATHKLVAYFNERPEVRDTTQSFWRRMKLVPFEASFLGDRADPNLRADLEREAPGILAWAVRGAVEWYARGLPVSRCVTDATSAYRGDEDPVGTWLIDFTTDCTATAFQTSATLYDDFETWCRKNGVESKEWSKKAFGKQLRIHGATESRLAASRGWCLTGCRKASAMTRLTDASKACDASVIENHNDASTLQTHDTSDATRGKSNVCACTRGTFTQVASYASSVIEDNPYGIDEPNF